MISQKARYAFKALLALGRLPAGDTLQIKEIAEREAIPRSFLEQILLDLKRGNLVASRRGKIGGYALAKTPAQIACGQVLRLIDGPVAPLPCLSRTAYRRCADCRDEASCAVRHMFAEVYEATIEVMDRTTLQSVLDRSTAASLGAETRGDESPTEPSAWVGAHI
jgi:Rrf2 family protein